MELKTKSKRDSMDCSIDVFYEQTKGFSKHLNDKENYKMVLVSSGSFAVEEDGEYKMISAPAGIMLNEKADFRLVSESNVKCDTICFKPTSMSCMAYLEDMRMTLAKRYLQTSDLTLRWDPRILIRSLFSR